MVKTASTMLELGVQAPDFSLRNAVDGKTVSLSDLAGAPALVVIFMCNHCPFVKHLADHLASFAKEYQSKGAAIIGISSNEIENFPQDGPVEMAAEAQTRGYTFPYLFDETQEVAKAYHAACTPDFYVFDRDHKLAYRGQFDDSRPNSDIEITGKDLRAAVDAVLAGQPATAEQKPSIGCNIKWIKGAEPEYFNPLGIS